MQLTVASTVPQVKLQEHCSFRLMAAPRSLHKKQTHSCITVLSYRIKNGKTLQDQHKAVSGKDLSATSPFSTPGDVLNSMSLPSSQSISQSSNQRVRTARPVVTSSNTSTSTASMAMRPFQVSAERVQPHSQRRTGAGSTLLSLSYVSSSSCTDPAHRPRHNHCS